MDKKIDNGNMAAKLELRRVLFRESGFSELDVLDACCGSGKIWSALRKELPVARYLGLDVKKRSGHVAMDSARYLSRPGWNHNFIDIDTYGRPWPQWNAMLQTLPEGREIAVALTIGSTFKHLSGDEYRALGIPFRLPLGICAGLSDIAVDACLTSTCGHHILGAWEATAGPHVRYVGVLLRGGQYVDLRASGTSQRVRITGA